MSSINLESCDEQVQNPLNSQFLQYKKQFNEGYQQMKQGTKNKSPSNKQKASNQINHEKPDTNYQHSQINRNGFIQQELHNNLLDNIMKDFNSPILLHKTVQDLQNLSDTNGFSFLKTDNNQKISSYSTCHLFKDHNKINKIDLYLSKQQQSNNKQTNCKQNDKEVSPKEIKLQTSSQQQILQIPISENYKLIGYAQNIFDIDLSNSQLTTFPQDIFQMPQLTKIKLDSNAITKIPQEISKLINLKQLSISDNKIYSLPSAFEGLQSLILLNISKNFLDPFPLEICKLKNLVILHIQNNYFISLPLEFSFLENLQEFSIEWFKYTFPSMNQIQSDYFTVQALKNECKRLYLLRKQQQLQTLSMQNQVQPNNLISQNVESNQQSGDISKIQQHFQMNSGLLSFQPSSRGTEIMIDVDEYSNNYESSGLINENSKIKNVQNIQTQYVTKIVNNQNLQTQNNTSDLSFQQFLTLFSKDPISYLSKCDVRGRNIFHLSAINQELSIIKAANFCQLHPQSINQMDDDFQTPLSLALLEEKFLSAKILLFFGADPLLGGGKLGTCLHIAVTKMDIEIISQILNRGGDANSRDFEGNTPLHLIFSIFRKDKRKATSIIELLIQKGADCNSKNFDNWSPLHLAVKRMQIEAIQWIASYDKYSEKFNWNIQGGNQQLSLLHLASKLGYTEIIQVIIEKVDPLLVSRCNQIARDLGQSNNLISKILKKKEIEVFQKHFKSQEKQQIEEENESSFIDKRSKQFKHLKSTFLLENKSFPIEKYEQLIEEKLAASKQLQQRNSNLENEQKLNTSRRSQEKQHPKVPSLKENIALMQRRQYQGENLLSQFDICNDTFRPKSQDNTQRSKTNSIQQQNLLLINELEYFCSQVFSMIKVNSTEITLEIQNQKTENLSNTDRFTNLKSITDGQNTSCELLEQEEVKNMWYGKQNKLKVKKSQILASSKIVKSQDDSFEIIEDSDDNIPEEYSSSYTKINQFNIQNYQSTSNQLWQLSETEQNLQNILKNSINSLIDERINLTWKLYLIQLLSWHIQLQKQNGSDLEKILQSKKNQVTSHASSIESNTQRSRSVIASRDDEKSISQRVLFDYLPLYLQSVIRYNSERNSNQLVAMKILDLISLIPNQNLLLFLENFFKQISNQTQKYSSSVNLMKNIFDSYSFLLNQQRIRKKITPLGIVSKKPSQKKNTNQNQENDQKFDQTFYSQIPPIAYFPSQSTAQVRIPRMNLNQSNSNNLSSNSIKHKASCYPTIQIDFYQKTQNELLIKENQKNENCLQQYSQNQTQNNFIQSENIQNNVQKHENRFESNKFFKENNLNKSQQNLEQTKNKIDQINQYSFQFEYNVTNKANASVSLYSQPPQLQDQVQNQFFYEKNQNHKLLTPRDSNKIHLNQHEQELPQQKIYSDHFLSQNLEFRNNKNIQRNYQDQSTMYQTRKDQKKSLTPNKGNTNKVSNLSFFNKNTSIQITPKKYENLSSSNQNHQTSTTTSSQAQLNMNNSLIDKQQAINKKDNLTSTVVNRDSNNQRIIEINHCATPSSNQKPQTQNPNSDRLTFSANSYNIQQKIQLNRIIQNKTSTTHNSQTILKKPEKLFEITLEKKKQNSQAMRYTQDNLALNQKSELNELLKNQQKNENSQTNKISLNQTNTFQFQTLNNNKQDKTENIQSKETSAVSSQHDPQSCAQNNNDNYYYTLKTNLQQSTNNYYQEISPKQISTIDSPKNKINIAQKQNSSHNKSQQPTKFSRFIK